MKTNLNNTIMLIFLCVNSLISFNSYSKDNIDILIRAFIPQNQEAKLMDRCFMNDKRGFSSDTNASSRITFEASLVLRNNKVEIKKVNKNKIIRSGKTIELDCDTNKIIKSTNASIEGNMWYGTPSIADGIVQLHFGASVTNPLTPPVISPKIDWSGILYWDTLNENIRLNFTVGKYPAFEAYAINSKGIIKTIMKIEPENGANPWKLYDFGIGINSRVYEHKVSLK